LPWRPSGNLYPGDSYVVVVALDVYDEGYGLTWLAAFGKAHNKEISLPEWGLESTSQDAGGGDDAYFVTQMADWIKANATGPELFWNSGDGTLPLDIPNHTNGNTPKATAGLQGRLQRRQLSRDTAKS
jgi:hypothetical protein